MFCVIEAFREDPPEEAIAEAYVRDNTLREAVYKAAEPSRMEEHSNGADPAGHA